MHTIVRHVEYTSKPQLFRLWHLTDWHLGARACDEALLERHISMIAADPHALWIGGGDYIDCVARKGDKRYEEATQAAWLRGENDVIDAQCERFFKLVAPIADKCVALVNGNHEHNALRYYDRDVYKHLVRGVARMTGREMNTLAIGIGGFVVLRFMRKSKQSDAAAYWSMHIFAHHGAGGGRLAGGDALSLERTLGDYAADLVLLGHRHKHRVVNRNIVEPTDQGARVVKRVGVMSASYLRSFILDDDFVVTTYPEHLLLPATEVGAVPIVVAPGQRDFFVVTSGGNGVGSRLPTLANEVRA
ncbi:MAG: metallophosphoesterase [Chloroflexota bacterium]|nr:metallophosphoesterase [Chloroflexota bacterium]